MTPPPQEFVHVAGKECFICSQLPMYLLFRVHPEAFNALCMSFWIIRVDEILCVVDDWMRIDPHFQCELGYHKIFIHLLQYEFQEEWTVTREPLELVLSYREPQLESTCLTLFRLPQTPNVQGSTLHDDICDIYVTKTKHFFNFTALKYRRAKRNYSLWVELAEEKKEKATKRQSLWHAVRIKSLKLIKIMMSMFCLGLSSRFGDFSLLLYSIINCHL